MPREGPHSFLSFARFRFALRITSTMVLPPYKGAVFRGAFGNGFRQLICMSPKADCYSCIMRQKCLYIAIFEPPPPPGYTDAAKFTQAPRPYVLNPPLTTRQSFRPRETLEFDLALLGPAIQALPYFIHIFQEVGRRGLGRERGKYELLQVEVLQNGAALPVYEAATGALTAFAPEQGPVSLPEDDRVTSITLQFLTPLRLKEKGDLVTRLTFPLFFANLSRRLSLLAAFYGGNGVHGPAGAGAPAVWPDFSSLMAQAPHITITANHLHWYDWERYSRRQDAVMKLGGLVGGITFRGDLGPFLPYLRLGEQVNIGQSTTSGLGRCQMTLHESVQYLSPQDERGATLNSAPGRMDNKM